MSLRPDLISIHEASQMLGVNEATLRQWTDEAKLKAFVTPGGHRRYSRSELKKFTGMDHKPLGIKDLVSTLEYTTGRHRQIAQSFIKGTPHGSKLTDEQQGRLSQLGRNLLMLITRHISQPSNREETLAGAREVGSGFGTLLAEANLPLIDAVEAFLTHREPIIQAAANLVGKPEVHSKRIAEAIPLANRFMDEALVAMIAAHQQFSPELSGGPRE
jgi:excisionase family DNA binding protein